MASRILGIDLGAYSVKIAVANPGFRHANIIDFYERVVPPGPEPHEVRAARVVGQLVRENGLTHDLPYAAIAGDQVFIHVLEFSFRNLRRADLSKAVGSELEGRLPIELEDMVFDFEQLPRLDGVLEGKAASEEPSDPNFVGDEESTMVGVAPPFAPGLRGPVAPPTEGMRVLACATRRGRARDLLDLLGAEGEEPRGLIAAPASYMRMAERIAACETERPGPPYAAIIDLGHVRTDVCVVIDTRAVYARTITRGGRDLTHAVERAFKISYEKAESAKHQDGHIRSRANPPPSADWAKIHETLYGELGPLARDLRQTMLACRAKTGVTVERAVLVGGGSRLNGIVEFLSEELRMPVSRLTAEDGQRILGEKLAGMNAPADIACLAGGVAFEGATGRPAFDLRQGPLAYKADLSFVRTKAPQLLAATLAVVFFAAISAFANLHKLRKAEEVLDARLAQESAQAFGQPLDAAGVLVRIGPGDAKHSPIPELSAYDILLAFNQALPSKEEATLDIEEIDVKPGKLIIKKGVSWPTVKDGETKNNAVQVIKLLESSLRESDCFKSVSDPAIKPGKDKSNEFSLNIDLTCEK